MTKHVWIFPSVHSWVFVSKRCLDGFNRSGQQKTVSKPEGQVEEKRKRNTIDIPKSNFVLPLQCVLYFEGLQLRIPVKLKSYPDLAFGISVLELDTPIATRNGQEFTVSVMAHRTSCFPHCPTASGSLPQISFRDTYVFPEFLIAESSQKMPNHANICMTKKFLFQNGKYIPNRNRETTKNIMQSSCLAAGKMFCGQEESMQRKETNQNIETRKHSPQGSAERHHLRDVVKSGKLISEQLRNKISLEEMQRNWRRHHFPNYLMLCGELREASPAQWKLMWSPTGNLIWHLQSVFFLSIQPSEPFTTAERPRWPKKQSINVCGSVNCLSFIVLKEFMFQSLDSVSLCAWIVFHSGCEIWGVYFPWNETRSITIRLIWQCFYSWCILCMKLVFWGMEAQKLEFSRNTLQICSFPLA